MKISDRLADYVVIGGFFWITQSALLLWVGFELGYGWTAQLGNVQALIAKLPDKAIAPLAALLGAVGLIIVFTTGVFIDLLGSFFFRAIELNAFLSQAKKNALWMQQFTSRYETYIQDDWSTVLAVPGLKRLLSPRLFMFWNKKAREENRDAAKKARAGRKSYMRMHSFLLSWISLVGGADKIELLNTQLSFWSISRAFAMALTLASLEAPYSVLLSPRTLDGFPNTSFPFLLRVIPIVFWLVSIAVSRAAYSRLCGTMFALCHIADKKLEGPPEISR